jgi:DNA-binding transcriptional LysR family regulator
MSERTGELGMEMHQVRYFLAVARTLNFTRAAEECHVAQPSLTRAIKLLECELGGELFRRERKLSHLTDLGRRMLPLLQQCYDSAVSAKSLATSMRKGEVAPLRIALSVSINMGLLVAPLSELTRAFPGLELKFARGTTHEVGESLMKGEAELAIAGPLGMEWERFDSWPLFAEPFVLMVNKSHRLAGRNSIELKQLAGERLLVRPYCELASQFDEALKAGCIEPATHHMVAEYDLVQMLEANLGVSILPLSAPRPESLRRIPIEGFGMTRTVMLYAVAGRQRTPAGAAFMKLIRAADWSKHQH